MSIEQVLIQEVVKRCDHAFDLIQRSAGQLDDEQFWHRPSSRSNSVGIIVQHLTGNLHQWVLAGLGGEEYIRERPKEFLDDARKPRQELLSEFAALEAKVRSVIANLPGGELLSPRRIQGFDQTVLSTLIAVVTHLELHAGQVAYLAKLLLDEKYVESWKPATTEQGRGA
ncbi:MAG TPA: DinB family protein [Bacteroidota bacterium]|nr:DinB family protein [Bacteroidota bacterium]